MISQSLTKTCI